MKPGTTQALARTWATAWLEAWSNKRGFWSQIGLMCVNDLVWIAFWMIFFDRVGKLRGWEIDQVLILFAVLTVSAGFVLGLMNNVRRITQLAADGGLDEILILPVPTLPHLLVSRIDPLFVGDLVFGVAIFTVLGNPTPIRFAAFVFGVVCAVLIITGFLVLVSSAGFFLGRSEAGDLGLQSLLLFSSYPVDIFGGATKLFLYGVIPAGFISSVPARLVTDFNTYWALGTLAVGLGFATAGWLTFNAGLRRYTSGSVWAQGSGISST
jgi:ABC-2 type transport system permease protein